MIGGILNSLSSWITRRKVIPPKDEVLSQFGTADPQVLSLGRELQIVVWNMEKGKEHGFSKDFKRLAAEKDIILLQEYLGTEPIMDTLTDTSELVPRMRYDVATSFLYDDSPRQIPTGVATGAICTPLDVQAQVTKAREPVVDTPKATILTRYPLHNGKSLLVINVHGLNRAGLEPFVEQMEEISRHIESQTNPRDPVFLAGDFNTNGMAKLEWLEQHFVQGLKMELATFDPDHRKRSKLSRIPLDWVFFRGMTLVRASVPVVTGSDHNPMVVTFDIGK